MKRMPMVAGNWKMYKTAGEGAILTQKLQTVAEMVKDQVEVVVGPPFTALHSVSVALEVDRSPVRLAAQNCFWETEGAFTGEISPRMLADLRCDYVILGHSERREYFGETNEGVNRKAQVVYEFGMTPIVCCGESLETREADQTESFVRSQISAAIEGLTDAQISKLVIAYEPIWAIGTGKTATPEMAQAVCASIRSVVSERFSQTSADRVRILYGGSVKPENAALFFAEEDIDGALVGGAALDAESFGAIIKAAR